MEVHEEPQHIDVENINFAHSAKYFRQFCVGAVVLRRVLSKWLLIYSQEISKRPYVLMGCGLNDLFQGSKSKISVLQIKVS